MSFDLEVYGKHSLSANEMAEVIASTDGLVAEWDDERTVIVGVHEDSTQLRVTIDGPFAIDEDDLPEGWRGVLSGATALYEIHADVCDDGDVRSAFVFARALAARVEGRIIDPQNAEPPAQAPPSRGASPGEKQFLHLHWYCMRNSDTELATTYLRAAREFLPLAVPTRFGTHQPFQGRFPRDDDAAFGRMYADECALDRLWLTGKKPSIGGYIDSWASPEENWPVDLLVTFEFEGLVGTGAIEAVKEFFIEVARKVGSFSAYAELNDAAYATSAPLRTLGEWSGLSDNPQWLTWYSEEYATLVHPYLTGGVARSFPEGFLHQWTGSPATAQQIEPLLSRDPWAPIDFFPLRSSSSRRRLLRAAKTMPSSLRGRPRQVLSSRNESLLSEIEVSAGRYERGEIDLRQLHSAAGGRVDFFEDDHSGIHVAAQTLMPTLENLAFLGGNSGNREVALGHLREFISRFEP